MGYIINKVSVSESIKIEKKKESSIYHALISFSRFRLRHRSVFHFNFHLVLD